MLQSEVSKRVSDYRSLCLMGIWSRSDPRIYSVSTVHSGGCARSGQLSGGSFSCPSDLPPASLSLSCGWPGGWQRWWQPPLARPQRLCCSHGSWPCVSWASRAVWPQCTTWHPMHSKAFPAAKLSLIQQSSSDFYLHEISGYARQSCNISSHALIQCDLSTQVISSSMIDDK
jgi:hypothetical protein